VFHALLSAAAGLAAAVVVSAAPGPKAEPSPHVSLKDHVNVKFSENLHSEQYPNNNLNALPVGKKKLGGIVFDIRDGVMQLGSSQVAGKPEKIEGIKVGRPVTKLHFLQACGYSTDNDTVVGRYVVRYEDKTTADIDVVYGRDVVDWWAYPNQAAPTKGEVAWEGENEASKGFEAKIKLYRMTWENPHPEKAVATLDFVAPNPGQPAAPFCVAITAEGK
jgi:hypothetical protein